MNKRNKPFSVLALLCLLSLNSAAELLPLPKAGVWKLPEYGKPVPGMAADYFLELLKSSGMEYVASPDILPLKSCRVIFLASCLDANTLSETKRKNLLTYLYNGGNLIISPTCFIPSSVKPIMGIKDMSVVKNQGQVNVKIASANTHEESSTQKETIVLDLKDTLTAKETPVFSYQVSTAAVLGTYENGQAAIIMNTCGRGSIICLGFPLKNTKSLEAAEKRNEEEQGEKRTTLNKADVLALLVQTVLPVTTSDTASPAFQKRILHIDTPANGFSFTKDKSQQTKDSIVSDKLQKLNDFWLKYNPIAEEKLAFEPLEALNSLFRATELDSLQRNELLQRMNQAEINQLKKKIGLAVGGNYQENFRPGSGADDVLIYKRRVQVGMDWNLLQNGLISNKYKQEILKNENAILELMPKKTLSEIEYMKVFHSIIYTFNKQKIALLQEREKIIEDKIAAANDLYLLKSLKKIDLMSIIHQQVDVRSMYQIYRSYNEQLETTENIKIPFEKLLPVVDIVPEKIFRANVKQNVDSIGKLQERNLQLQNSYWNSVNLSANIRYNYYDLVNSRQATRNFISTGIGFSLPIPFNVTAGDELNKEKHKIEMFEQQTMADARLSEQINLMYEFRYKLKQYNNFTEKHKRYLELIRLERVKESLHNPDFNPVAALNYLDEYLGVKIEMLDLQQQMYINLLDIYFKSEASGVLDIIKPYEGSIDTAKKNELSRAMYIWTKSTVGHSPEFIYEYLQLHGINKALIAVNKNKENHSHTSVLIATLRTHGIQIEAVTGNNSLIKDPAPERYYDEVLSPYTNESLSTLHLDVEPHTFPEWQTQKTELLNDYMQLLQKTRQYCDKNNLQLAVSIPTYYPEDVLNTIYTLADRVYVMAYENVKPSFLKEKLKEELLLGLNKTTIALRSRDFQNRLETENLITYLRKELGISDFAYHELDGFITLDKVTEKK